MKVPLFRLRFDALREIPSEQASPARQRQASNRPKVFVVLHAPDSVISISFPIPVRSRFGVISKPLFALPQRLIEGSVLQRGRGLEAGSFRTAIRAGEKALRVRLFSR
jgi:hypothetical protein